MSSGGPQRLKVLHISSSLGLGGAEMTLASVLGGEPEFSHEVIGLTGGPVVEQLRQAGTKVSVLGWRRGRVPWRGLGQLRQAIVESQPDIIQSWMYHADLAAGLAAASLPNRPPVVWNIRHSALGAESKRLTRLVRRLSARLSHRLPAMIVCCSEVVRDHHVQVGYDAARMVVIDNGFELGAGECCEAVRQAVRVELGVRPEALVVAHVARFARVKDHRTMLLAAGLVARRVPAAHFVFCGQGVDERNGELQGWLEQAGLRGQASLLGPRTDVPRLLAAADASCLSSVSEGMPRVLGEALACGVPVVTTDVGSAAELTGPGGLTVPARDPAALATALECLLAMPTAERRAMGQAGRAHIAAHYDPQATQAKYHAVWRKAAAQRTTGPIPPTTARTKFLCRRP